jgi:hypothetical protein
MFPVRVRTRCQLDRRILPLWFLARSPAGTDLLLMAGGGVCHRISLATLAATDFTCDDGRPAAIAW